MKNNKEEKFTWEEISKKIDSVWRSNSWNDSWGVKVIYKGMFKKYLKNKLYEKQ